VGQFVTPVKRRATIVEVAERANVAFSTVSRVLNGGYASQQVRARVEQAAKDLGYTPSPIARNLKMGRQGSIGLIVESSQGSWFTQVLGGIEEALEQKMFSLLLGSLQLRGRYDSTVIGRWIAERRVDGLIFCRCTRHEEALVERASKMRLPMVFVGPDEHFGAGPVFASRNRDAAHELTRHLVSFGHRRFAYVGGPEDSLDVLDRLGGLRETLTEHGLELPPENVTFAISYSPEVGIAFAQRWLAMPRATAPTAVVCANDALAIAFLRTVLQHGVRVPDEVSVTGFDGLREGALYWPALTTAQQLSHAMGNAACLTLLKMIDNPEAAQPSYLDLPAELIVRESTGPAPRYA
jgi:DNA-binding LacI/PurR family transcriptional regulator